MSTNNTPTPAPPGTLAQATAHTFPADTDPEEMTPEQQAAYWKNDAEKWKALSRKHERNRYAEADFEELEQLREQKDQHVAALLRPAVRAEFKVRAPHLSDDELDAFLDDIDVTAERFYTDGVFNTERIERLAAMLHANDSGDEEEPAPPAVTLGGVLARGHTTVGGRQRTPGDSRHAAYERTKAKLNKTNQ